MPPPERQKNAARETRAINQYQLADCIGKGAFGAVYKALNMENGETVAIKQVKLSNIPRSELGVIMMEIDLLKKLNHPNIVKYNGFVKTKEYLNIILEFCENGSLTSIVKKFGKFPENLVAVYVVQVLEGLRYLHEQGVIHRDIKGANILTTKEGLVKLADFGVATRGAAPGSDAPVEEEAMVVGSPYWMAPEVIELSGATTASDVWSVGCTVIELLQGQPPYHDLAPMPALFRIVQDDHPPLPEGASGGLKDFLMQCFQKDYNLRVSAKKLLKHPWIQSARRKREAARETYGMSSMVNKFAEDVRSVQQWNAAINEPIHRHPFKKAIQQELDLNQPLQTANGRLSTGPQTSKDENWDADFSDALSLSGNNLAKISPGIFEYPSHEAKFSTSSTIAGTATSPLSSNTSLNDRASEMSRSPSPSKPPLPPGSLGIRKRLSAVDLAEQAEEAEDCWDNDFEVDDTEVAATRLVELKLRKSLETVQTMDGKINDRNKSTRENAPQGENPKFNERDNDKQKNNERHVNDAPGQVHNRQDRLASIDEDNTQTITMNFKKVLQAKLQPSSVKPTPSAAKPQTFISTSSATPVATATFLNPVLTGASSLPPMLNFAGSKYMESEADDVYDDVFAEEDEKILHEKLGKLNINFAGLKVGDTSRIKQRKPVAASNETSRKMDAKQAWTTSDARELVMTTTLSLSTGSLLTTTVGASDPGASEITETPKATATLPPNATKPSNLKQSNSPLSARLTATPVATGSPKAISAFLTTAARSHTTANTTTGDSPSGYKAAASRFFASFRDGRRNQLEEKVKSETSTEVTTATGDELTLRNRKVEHLMELDILGDDEEEEEDERPVRKEDIVEADEEGCDTIVLRPGRVGSGNLPRDVKGADLSKEEEHESEIPANRTGPLSRYAETDDDDYDDVFFGNSGAAGPAGMGLVNGELEKAELKIRSRARSFGAGGMNGSPNGEYQFAGNENCRAEEDEEEDDDPFASLEEGMDEPDLEENVLRDKHARLCSEIESLIRQLQPEQAEDTVQGICDELLLLLTENPTLRSNVITYHGVIPIMELLEQRHQPSTTDRVSANVVQKLLRIVNLIIEGSIEIQENFCLVGGVPCVTAFASSKYPFYVRLEAARFVRRVCQASTLSLQMFVSGRGLRVLAGLLAGDYGEGKELVLTAIDGVASVFELQGPTPKNDFCRLFANCGLLEPLASALSAVSADRDPRAQDYVARIVHVLLIFSQADAKVKELVATRPVVKKILGELDNVPPAQTLGLVKCIKNLSMTSTALDTLEKAGAIETLAELLSRNSGPYITEMYNQVLNALYNLCRLNRRRQEAAAQAGVVPPLQRLVKTNSPLKQFALPVLCDLAHAGKICRGVLWQNDGLRFYLSLLGDPYWQINALEAVSAWLSDEEEKMRLEAILVVPGSVDALTRAFLTARTTGLEKLLDPLYKILVKAQGVARLLVERNGVAQKVSERLKLPNAQVRLGVLRVLAALTETHPQPLALITKLGLQSTLHRLAAEDPGLLVRELAAKLAAGVKAPDPGTPIATPVRPRPEGRLPPVEKGKLRGG